jgi:flavorubredoxin
MADVAEVGPDLFRLSTYVPQYDLVFNQYLLRDDEPLLFHTGFRSMFDGVRDAVSQVLDPSTIRWISFSHFEADECCSLNDWLQTAPSAQAACSTVGAMVSLTDFAIRTPRALKNGEVLCTGKYRCRFLQTPHVPHGWDAGLIFEETEGTLFSSDLFLHMGEGEPTTEADLVPRAREAILGMQASPLAHDLPYTPYTDRTLQRLADLKPRRLAVMHGSAFLGDGAQALRGLAGVLEEAYAHAQGVTG